MKVLTIVAMLAMCVALAACEPGGARVVSSCSQCMAKERCVEQGLTLYCSDQCADPLIICQTPCAPMKAADGGLANAYWVCTPDTVYQSIPQGRSTFHKMGGNCATDLNYQCTSGEYCLGDTSDSSVFFCAQSCSVNADCALNCCADTTTNGHRCAPFYYCP